MKIKKRKKNTYLSYIVFIFLSFLITCIFNIGFGKFLSQQNDGSEGYSFSDKIALAYYYIWYIPRQFYDEKALQDVHPILGPYDSSDPYIIEEHIKMAKQAKLDALAVSWWYDSSANGMNARLETIFAKAATYGLKVTIDLEAADMTMTDATNCLRYYLTEYRNKPAALKVEGKPAVLIWSSYKYSPDDWQKTFNQLEKGGLSAFYLVSGQTDPDYLGPFRCLEEYALVDIADSQLPSFFQDKREKVDEYNQSHPENPAQWHATIMPGFDETNIPGRNIPPATAGWKDRKNGEYYKMTFESALSSNPNWIHITSFNELAEHTHIEPTQEFGWTYIEMTADFIDDFKHRLSGKDRYETAVAISKQSFPYGAENVVLARGDDFPDALAGAPLAAKYNAPILLTNPGFLTSASQEEIVRLQAKHVFLLGSSNAISGEVVSDLEEKCGLVNQNIHRYGGETRYETAQLISQQLSPPANKTAIIATGENYPDALASASVAAFKGMPILLVRGDIGVIPTSTKQALTDFNIENLALMGETDVVPEPIENEFKNDGYNCSRYGGETRYETCVAIANWSLNLGMEAKTIALAVGENFPDALAIGPFAAKNKAPLILVRGFAPNSIGEWVNQNKGKIKTIYIAGGPDVVSISAVSEIRTLAGL